MDNENLDPDCPITEYYKEHITDFQTISKTGQWWTALAVIEDPKTGKPFVSLYRWQYTENGWKQRKQFKFNSKKGCKKIIQVLIEMAEELPD
jgi:hypothetical protein